MLPLITAAPAEHHQDSLLVGEAEEALGLQFAFQADGVQVHILYETKLLFEVFWILAKQHVLRPTRAADQYGFAVHLEEAKTFIGQLRCYFANAKVNGLLVGDLAVLLEGDGRGLQMRRAHLVWPPERRVFDAEFNVTLRIKDYSFVFTGLQFGGLLQ